MPTYDPKRARLTLLGLVLIGAVLPTAPAEAIPASEAVRLLNVQRAANGMAPVTENPAYDDGCAKHNHYMSLNGITHFEDPAKPGYTPEGDAAGRHSELAQVDDSSFWSETTNPWSHAPYHLYGMFAPATSDVGYDAREGYACLWGSAANAPHGFAAYTGGAGRVDVPYEEHAAEGNSNLQPETPQMDVGLPADQVTGPNLLLFPSYDFLYAPEVPQVISASLVGPHGPVEIRVTK
jgi:hypothetical protein